MERYKIWIFIAGVVIAILAGLDLLVGNWAVWVLAIFGLVVGYLNVSGAELKGFLVSAVALQLSASALESSGALEEIPVLGETATSIFSNVVILISAALLVVAIKGLIEGRNVGKYGVWALYAGVLLAILTGLTLFDPSWTIWVLAVLGLIVGYYKVVDQADVAGRFLFAAIALQLSAGALANVPTIGATITDIFSNIVVVISSALLLFAFVATFRAMQE